MPFKQLTFIFLISSFIGASLLVGPTEVESHIEYLIEDCNPETIGISRIKTPTTQHQGAKRDLQISWCFTMEGSAEDSELDLVNLNNGNLIVVQHVVLWMMGSRAPTLVEQVSIELDCIKEGFVGWDHEHHLISFNNGKVECQTVDLHALALVLSNGQLDICDGEVTCEIPVHNIVNYINIPENVCETSSSQFPTGNALFVYEEVLLGTNMTQNSERQLLLRLNGEQMTANVPPPSSQGDMHGVAIEQHGTSVSFAVNGQLVAEETVSNSITYFNSQSTTITFGYNPETGEYFNGCIGKSIFDPFTGGPSFWGG